MVHKNKTPKMGATPISGKNVKVKTDPGNYDRETIVWRFCSVDLDGAWGWQTGAAKAWWNTILPKLQSYETMTWAAIMAAAGGRTNGNNSHPVNVEDCTKQARDRLVDINQEDISELFSLRLEATKRIYGIRDGRVLKLLWYDPYHGQNAKAVYPTKGG